MKRVAFALLAGSVVCACSSEPTEIVVIVHTDFAVPAELDTIRIDVLEPDGETKSSTLALGSVAELPGRLGITHTRGATYPVEVTAIGLLAGVPLVSHRARVGFVPEQSRLLELFLVRACRETSCPADTSCENGVCLSIERGALPPWRGRVPSFDASTGSDAAPRDAGTDGPEDASRDASVDSGEPCDELRRLPRRPDVADTPDDGPARFYALHALDFGTRIVVPAGCAFQPPPVATPRTQFELGYDIDGARTSSGTTAECAPLDPTFGPGSDGCGGVDNVLGAVYGLIASFFPCALAELGDHVAEGRGGFLLWVRGWNGTPNDRRVEVALMPTSYGVTASALGDGGAPRACGPGPRDGGLDPRPTGEDLRWDGTDLWFVTEARPGDLGTWDCDRVEPFSRDLDAYVVDGLLVSVINRVVPIQFGPCLSLPLGNPVITARITDSELTEGIVQGRISVASVRAAVPLFDVSGEMLENLNFLIDNNADVNTECGYSETPCEAESTVRCDALSSGLGFDAMRAQFGGVRPSLQPDCR